MLNKEMASQQWSSECYNLHYNNSGNSNECNMSSTEVVNTGTLGTSASVHNQIFNSLHEYAVVNEQLIPNEFPSSASDMHIQSMVTLIATATPERLICNHE